ncbi:hypothetical protein [Lysobacter sp. Root690]|uniref:hypothetical protein n=1 Tax=Lysobacter sp. Root690 TaxID=1736588 RepID=UPI0006FE79B7|nr:hypothetical protein [Lysobacter sp. Root690]KRB07959.1 hypothetical protein ASD86_09155 [Lysobacter sp. Root690]
MKFLQVLLASLIFIAGCSPRPAVDQVTIKLHGQKPNEVVALIEGKLFAHGFNRTGASQPGRPGLLEVYSYESGQETYANVYVNSPDCVGFVTLVDLDTKDRALAKAVFLDVITALKKDKAFSFTIGDCSNLPQPM